jgi:hypothetical protein
MHHFMDQRWYTGIEEAKIMDEAQSDFNAMRLVNDHQQQANKSHADLAHTIVNGELQSGHKAAEIFILLSLC